MECFAEAGRCHGESAKLEIVFRLLILCASLLLAGWLWCVDDVVRRQQWL